MPNDNIDDHPHAIEVGQVVGAVEGDQQADIHPLNISNDLSAGQRMAATIGDSGGGDAGQHAVELQAVEEGDIQDDNGIGVGGESSGGDAGQYAAELQAAEEGKIQDDNGIGDGGNAGQGVADPQHGGDATIDGDGIGNGDDGRRRRRRRLRRLRKLLLFLMLEVVRLAALYYVKTVFLMDSLSLFHVLRLCVGIVLIGVSIVIECLALEGSGERRGGRPVVYPVEARDEDCSVSAHLAHFAVLNRRQGQRQQQGRRWLRLTCFDLVLHQHQRRHQKRHHRRHQRRQQRWSSLAMGPTVSDSVRDQARRRAVTGIGRLTAPLRV